MYELTVIIPTLNESESIRKTVNLVMNILDTSDICGQVLVVDDDSTDGTHPVLADLVAVYPNFNYIIRRTNHGLSQSLATGFCSAQSDVILVIDADGQHPAKKIPELYQAICNGADVAIASRYIPGGEIWYLPLYRKLLSRGATYLAQFFIPDIQDSGSGFFAFRKKVIENAPLQPQGFRMLFEILGKGHWETATEIPYTFQVREHGVSKLTTSTVMSYLKQVWGLFTYSVTNKESRGHAEIRRVLTFMLVGFSGVIVSLAVLYYLTEYRNIWYLWSAIIALESSILTNFVLNDTITFGDFSNGFDTPHRLISYHMVSLVGTAITLGVTYGLTGILHQWYMWSAVIGIGSAFIWNFTVNRGMTWRKKND